MREVKWSAGKVMTRQEQGTYDYAVLVEEVGVGSFACESYGVRVTDLGTGEEARVENITVSTQRIGELCALLARNQVGPTHLRDVVEDWL